MWTVAPESSPGARVRFSMFPRQEVLLKPAQLHPLDIDADVNSKEAYEYAIDRADGMWVRGLSDLASAVDQLTQAADVSLRLGVDDEGALHLPPAVVNRGVVAAPERGADLDE